MVKPRTDSVTQGGRAALEICPTVLVFFTYRKRDLALVFSFVCMK